MPLLEVLLPCFLVACPCSSSILELMSAPTTTGWLSLYLTSHFQYFPGISLALEGVDRVRKPVSADKQSAQHATGKPWSCEGGHGILPCGGQTDLWVRAEASPAVS